MRKGRGLAIVSAIVLLVACGGEGANYNPNGGPGSLIVNPPYRVASLTAADFAAQVGATASGQQLLQVTGQPKCGVDIHYIMFNTTGAAGEATTSSGALMVPTGDPANCTGNRPVVLYAHGTATTKGYNIADITNTHNEAFGELGLVAATFAAQGFIVVAPNYAGYDVSNLGYHPYLNAIQESGDMINSLKAARTALGSVPAGKDTHDSGKLYVTGYSEGGYVAMATLQALQAQGTTVAAGAPMSGPYSVAAFGDAVFYGNVNLGGTVFSPLLSTGYQKAYGNIYNTTSDLFTAQYATGIDTLLPSAESLTQLFQEGKLPQAALFQKAPTGIATLDPISPPAGGKFDFAFATSGYLINTSYRAAYLGDAQANPDGAVPTQTATPFPAANPSNGLRQAFKKNDLRTYQQPGMPVLMCGGNADPTVFFSVNTQLMDGIWTAVAGQGAPLKFAQLDVDNSGSPGTFTSTGLTPVQSGTMAAVTSQVQAGFTQAKQAATDPNDPTAVVRAYHGSLVPPFCTVAAREFFKLF